MQNNNISNVYTNVNIDVISCLCYSENNNNDFKCYNEQQQPILSKQNSQIHICILSPFSTKMNIKNMNFIQNNENKFQPIYNGIIHPLASIINNNNNNDVVLMNSPYGIAPIGYENKIIQYSIIVVQTRLISLFFDDNEQSSLPITVTGDVMLSIFD